MRLQISMSHFPPSFWILPKYLNFWNLFYFILLWPHYLNIKIPLLFWRIHCISHTNLSRFSLLPCLSELANMAKSSVYLMSTKYKSSSKAFSFFICFVFLQSELIVSVYIIIRSIEKFDVKNLPLVTNIQVTYLYIKHRVCPEVRTLCKSSFYFRYLASLYE